MAATKIMVPVLGGAVAVVGAAGAYFGLGGGPSVPPAQAERTAIPDGPLPVALDASEAAGAPGEIRFCLPDITGPRRECYTAAEIARMGGQPTDYRTADGSPRGVTVTMVSPSDFSAPEEVVTDCAGFARLKREDWGGLTSVDMAREAQFLRFCGLKALARMASPPRSSGFAPDGLSKAELDAVPAREWPTLGEGGTPGAAPVISTIEGQPGSYRIDLAAVSMVLHDVAHADFDGDGEGERLAYLAGRARGGTAGFARWVLLERSNGETRLRPIAWE